MAVSAGLGMVHEQGGDNGEQRASVPLRERAERSEAAATPAEGDKGLKQKPSLLSSIVIASPRRAATVSPSLLA